MKTAEEILIEAAELVERPEGWCQGSLADRNRTQVCLEGALIQACLGILYLGESDLLGRDPELFRAYHAVRKEVGRTPALWNDQPGRTAEEVATVLRNSKRHL